MNEQPPEQTEPTQLELLLTDKPIAHIYVASALTALGHQDRSEIARSTHGTMDMFAAPPGWYS